MIKLKSILIIVATIIIAIYYNQHTKEILKLKKQINLLEEQCEKEKKDRLLELIDGNLNINEIKRVQQNQIQHGSSSFDFNKSVVISDYLTTTTTPQYYNNKWDKIIVNDNTFNESYYIGDDSFVNSLMGGARDVSIRPDDLWSLIVNQISVFLSIPSKHNDDEDNHTDNYNDNHNNNSNNIKLNIENINNQDDKFYKNLENQMKSKLSKYHQLLGNDGEVIYKLLEPTFSTTNSNDKISIMTRFIGKYHNGNNSSNNGKNNPSTKTFNTKVPNIRVQGTKQDYMSIKYKLELIVNQIIESINNDPTQTYEIIILSQHKLSYSRSSQIKEWSSYLNSILKEFISIVSDNDGDKQVFISSKYPEDSYNHHYYSTTDKSKTSDDDYHYQEGMKKYVKFWKSILVNYGDTNENSYMLDGWISTFYYFSIAQQGKFMKYYTHAPYFSLQSYMLNSGYSYLPIDIRSDNEKGTSKSTATLFAGHLSSNIKDNIKFSPRLDWLLAINN